MIPAPDSAFLLKNGRMRYGSGSAQVLAKGGGDPSSDAKYQESLRYLARRSRINQKTAATVYAVRQDRGEYTGRFIRIEGLKSQHYHVVSS